MLEPGQEKAQRFRTQNVTIEVLQNPAGLLENAVISLDYEEIHQQTENHKP
jgi:hypothetical protein